MSWALPHVLGLYGVKEYWFVLGRISLIFIFLTSQHLIFRFLTFFPCHRCKIVHIVTFSCHFARININNQLGRAKRIWYLSPMRAAKVQASLRIRAVSPEPSLLAHTSSESRGTFRQKARSLAPLNGWACAVKMCHDGMLEDTNSLDRAQLIYQASGL